MRARAWRTFGGCAVAAGMMGAAGCAGAPGAARAGSREAVVRNPAGLLAMVASETTPEASRESADRELVAEQGARQPARLAVLEQMWYAPGESAGMRDYAMDALAKADPALAGEALILYLPRLEEGEVLAHACGLCVTLGDERVVESLIRSMRRAVGFEGVPTAVLRERPEWGAIEKLSALSVVETLYRVIGTSRDLSARVAALDIVQQAESGAAVMGRVKGMTGEDTWMGDLRWWAGEFGALPLGESESVWMNYLHRPEWAGLVARAAARNRRLRGASDYVFAARFVGVLGRVDEAGAGMTRAELLAGLKEDGVGDAGKLTRGDLLAVRLLMRGLRDARVVTELHRQGLDDYSDTTTAHGGLLSMGNGMVGLTATTYPPLEADGDGEYLASDALVQEAGAGIAMYHFEFQKIRNGERAGPTERDLRFARRTRSNGVVVTSLDTRKMAVTYYTAGGVVVELGVYEVK